MFEDRKGTMKSCFRLWIFTVFTIVSLMAATPAFSQDRSNPVISDTKDGLSKIISSGELRVAMTADDIWPFYFVNKTGELRGYDIFLAKDIANSLGVKPTFIRKGTHNDLVNLLKNNEADIIISGWSYSPQRAIDAYTSKPYVTDSLSILANILFVEKIKKDKSKTIFEALNAPNIKIGVNAGQIYGKLVKKFFPKAQKVSTTEKDLSQKLKNEEIDAWFGMSSFLYTYLKRNPELNLYIRKFNLPFNDKFVVGVSHENPELQSWIDSYFESEFAPKTKQAIEIVDTYLVKDDSKEAIHELSLQKRSLLLALTIIACIALIMSGKKIRKSQNIPLLLDIRTIVSGILLGCVAGWWFPSQSLLIKPIGTIYIRYLQMCSIPILFCCVVLSVGKLYSVYSSAKLLMFFAIAIFLIFTAGSTIAMLLGSAVKPGAHISKETRANLSLSINENTESYQVPKDSRPLFWRMLDEAIQPSFFNALTTNNTLSILFVAVLVGIGITYYGGNEIAVLIDKLQELFYWLFSLSLYTLPFALIAIISENVATLKENSLFNVLINFNLYVATGYTLLFFLGLMMISFAWKCSPFRSLSILKEALLTGFSTESAVATIPFAIKACEKFDERVRQDLKTNSETVPLWIIFPEITESFMFVTVVLFLLQLFGINLTFNDYIFLAIVGSVCAISTIGLKPPMHLLAITMLTIPYSLPFEMVFAIAFSTELILGRFAGVISFMIGFGTMPYFERITRRTIV